MVPRPLLSVLVLALAVLLVVFAVVMAFYALVSALADPIAAKVLLWVGITCLILLVVDIVMLVGCLGLQSLQDGDRRDENEGS